MNPSKASLPTSNKWESPSIGAPVIDKGIPIPKKAGGRKPVWPFAQMEIGDSFFMAGDRIKCQRALANAAQHYQRKTGAVFVTRAMDGGARIWRVAGACAKAEA